MNGIHDLGGKEGFGPVLVQADEPVFHETWERSVFAAVMGCMAQGFFTIDEFRHAIERMGNAHYLEGSYYEHWLAGLETLLTEKGLLSDTDIGQLYKNIKAENKPYEPHPPIGDKQLAPALAQGIGSGASSERPTDTAPRFKPGDTARTRNMHPQHHTRLPAYARGKRCSIRAHYGAHVLPDTNAHGQGESPQHLYSVRFESAEIWGEQTDRVGGALYLDVWESYLEQIN